MTNHGLDACLPLVADRHRRRVIQCLRHESTGTTTFEALVDQVHSLGSDSSNGPRRDREELAIQLRHTHLPKLADRGVVEFDHRTGVVRYHPDEQLETVLDSLPEEVALRKL
ncbi:MAG: ArsR family transcriptional regulator [Halorhabdus sp.]